MDKLSKLLVFLLLFLAAAAVAEGRPADVKLSIPNISCVSCEMRIEAALAQLPGIHHVSFDVEAKTALVVYDADQVDVARIVEACESVGYPATVVAAVGS